jgi:predicted nucleic acid-binding protein
VIFVDSGAWAALLLEDDVHHARAVTWYLSNSTRLITTDYVIDETLTLIMTRGRKQRAIAFGDQFFPGPSDMADLYVIDDIDRLNAWDVFHRFRDKQWSFTDCTSYAVMKRLGIDTAFSFDDHFRQFGTVTVVP